MKSRYIGATLFVSVLLGAVPASANDEAISQGRTAALAWLARLDGGEYDETWDAAGELLRGAVTKKEWSARVAATLAPMGPVRSRQEKTSKYEATLPGAPEGQYVVLEYGVVFENEQKAVETVILRKEPDGLWRVSGWSIR